MSNLLKANDSLSWLERNFSHAINRLWFTLFRNSCDNSLMTSLLQTGLKYVIIKLSAGTYTAYTVGIPIFWLADLYHVILGCDETTSLTSLSWCKFNTPQSLHHGLGWFKVWRSVFAVYLIWIIKMLTHLLLVNYRDVCTRSLTMNSKFSKPHDAASCVIEISRSSLMNSCR